VPPILKAPEHYETLTISGTADTDETLNEMLMMIFMFNLILDDAAWWL
jgi:hypothetical protein